MTAQTAAAAVKLGHRVLHLGMHGADVRVLQHDLTVVGIKTRVDGRYDRLTRGHVKRFQRAHHLSVDGVLGPNTLRALDNAVRAHNRARKASSHSGGTSTTTATSTSTSTSGPNCAPATADGGGQVGLFAAPTPCPTVQALHLNNKGLVVIPDNVPIPIKHALLAANRIAHTLYVYGGGHSGWGKQRGYDCSGTTSYVLHAAGMMVKSQGDRWDEPFDSSQFERYGDRGKSPSGWITLYTNAGHVYMKISNLYFDTAAQGGRAHGTRWSTTRLGPTRGWWVRHPKGW